MTATQRQLPFTDGRECQAERMRRVLNAIPSVHRASDRSCYWNDVTEAEATRLSVEAEMRIREGRA